MSDRIALLKAIVAEPQDDVVRLIFADYCRSIGNEKQADFITNQIKLARDPGPGCMNFMYGCGELGTYGKSDSCSYCQKHYLEFGPLKSSTRNLLFELAPNIGIQSDKFGVIVDRLLHDDFVVSSIICMPSTRDFAFMGGYVPINIATLRKETRINTQFKRGFVTHLTAKVEVFTKEFVEALEFHPIESITLEIGEKHSGIPTELNKFLDKRKTIRL